MEKILLKNVCSRWLVSRGRANEAVTILKRIERINKTKIPDEIMDEFIVRTGKLYIYLQLNSLHKLTYYYSILLTISVTMKHTRSK